MSRVIFANPATDFASMTAADVRATYGAKAAGIHDLHSISSRIAVGGGEVPFRLQRARVLAVGELPRLTDGQFRQTLGELLAGNPNRHDRYAVLMARSSAVAERPGTFPTLAVTHDAADPVTSARRFREALEQVTAASPDMGVLCMPMAGAITPLADGRLAIGPQNSGLVVETHYALNDRELSIEIAHGLGSGVVERSGGVVQVTVNRDTGKVTHFGHKSEIATRDNKFNGWARSLLRRWDPPRRFDQYVQYSARVYLVETGEEIAVPLALLGVNQVGRRDALTLHGYDSCLNLVLGRISKEFFSDDLGLRGKAANLGLTPFPTLDSFARLTETTKSILAAQGHPSQIEGLFEVGDDRPVIVQIEDLPLIGTRGEVTILDADIKSEAVLGFANSKLPLIIIGNDFDIEVVEKYNHKHPQGYAILFVTNGSEAYSQRIRADKVAKNCRVRMMTGTEQWSAHGILEMRRKMAASPDDGYVIAQNVVFGDAVPANFKRAVMKAHMATFDEVEIQSDGKILAVKIPKKPWWKLW